MKCHKVLNLVSGMHITAAVSINDDKWDMHADYEKRLEELAPHTPLSRGGSWMRFTSKSSRCRDM